MGERLFAFRVAKPIEPTTDEVMIEQEGYDPQTQTSVWSGGTEALAYTAFCSGSYRWQQGYKYCYTSRYGCQSWGGRDFGTGRYFCDYS